MFPGLLAHRPLWSVSGALQPDRKVLQTARMVLCKEERMPPIHESATRENTVPEENHSTTVQEWLLRLTTTCSSHAVPTLIIAADIILSMMIMIIN